MLQENIVRLCIHSRDFLQFGCPFARFDPLGDVD